MQIIQKFREMLPGMVTAELDNILASIRAFWMVEHKEDGTHSFITCDSLTIGGLPVTPGAGTGPAGPVGPMGPPGPEGPAGTDNPTHVVGPASSLVREIAVYTDTTGKLITNASPTITASGVLVSPAGADFAQAVIIRQNLRVDTGITAQGGDITSEVGKVSANLGFIERGRTVPAGEWIDIPYSAANFTAVSGTWTVEAGDVTTLRYTLIGNTVLLLYELGPTSVSLANGGLRIALPAGVVVSKPTRTLAPGFNNGTAVSTVPQVAVGQAFISIPILGGTNWAVSTNNTFVQGQITIPI